LGKDEVNNIHFSFSNKWGNYDASVSYSRDLANAPTVVFLHGLAARNEYYTWLTRTMVENGYVFAAFNVPKGFSGIGWGTGQKLFKVYKDGFTPCIKELSTIRGLDGVMDSGAVGAMGHSLGGLTALLATADDSCIKAVVAMSPPVHLRGGRSGPTNLDVPVQLQVATHEGPIFEGVQRYYSELVAPEKELIVIEGGNHILYMDELDRTFSFAGRIVWSLLKAGGRLVKLPFGSTRADITLEEQHSRSSRAFLRFFSNTLRPRRTL
jgi:predicted dienelactone hydrolase